MSLKLLVKMLLIIMIKVTESGELIANNLNELNTIALCYLRSGMLPSDYNTVEKVVTGMQFAISLGLKPLTALRQIYIVNGVPNLFGDLPLALARKSGLIEDFDEFLFDSKFEKICFENKNIDIDIYGALCKIKRKGENVIEKTFTIKDAVLAKLISFDDKGNKHISLIIKRYP